MSDRKELTRVIKLALGTRSQDWLAEQSNVSQPTISRLLRGVGEIEAKNVISIASALSLNANGLLALAGLAGEALPEEPIDQSALEIARQLTRLPADLKDPAIDAVSGVVDGFRTIAERRGDYAAATGEATGELTPDQRIALELRDASRNDREFYDDLMDETESRSK